MLIKLDIGILKDSDVKLKDFEKNLNEVLSYHQGLLDGLLSRIDTVKIPNYELVIKHEVEKFKSQLDEIREQMLKLQIAFEDGRPVQFPAGGAIETDLVQMLTAEIMSRGVAFKTASHVESDVREGIKAAIYKFKEKILQVPVKLHV